MRYELFDFRAASAGICTTDKDEFNTEIYGDPSTERNKKLIAIRELADVNREVDLGCVLFEDMAPDDKARARAVAAKHDIAPLPVSLR